MQLAGNFLSIFCVLTSLTGIFTSCRSKQPSSTCLYTTQLPVTDRYCSELRCMPAIGNGYVATIISSNNIHVAGLYNGKANVEQGYKSRNRYDSRKHFLQNDEDTHRARIPSTVSVNFTLKEPGIRSYALDIAHGVFYQWFQNENVEIEQRIYAHKIYKYYIINEISVIAKKDTILNLETNHGRSSEDIHFSRVNSTLTYDVTSGQIKDAEVVGMSKTNISVVFTKVPKVLSFQKSERAQTVRFLTAITTSLEFKNPTFEAIRIWNEGDDMEDLFSSHATGWLQLWQTSNISITTENLFLPQLVYSSLYNLISSIREDWLYGLSPGGLAGGEEYLGHVFWDQDIWMYPTILMLFPELARSLLQYRYERLEAAEHIANAFGFKGSMYPWESAVTGFEVCPAEVYGHHEIHVTGDIAFAVQQYYLATGDLEWIKKYGYGIIYKTADFWASRVVFNGTKDAYDVNDVMPPDEYQYPVNNSFFTNAVAKLNLQSAIMFSNMLGKQVPDQWSDIAERIYLPYDENKNYHPEFESFDITSPGMVVKQADVILTNFPLMFSMNTSTVVNDLTYYDNITDANGPAMTHSMFTIGWLQVGNNLKATQSFEKNFDNINGPFRMWSEVKDGRGAKNFITAAGGFLQSLVFGYGGIRLKFEGLHFSLAKPPGASTLRLNGVQYHGFGLNLVFGTQCFIELASYTSTSQKLIVEDIAGKIHCLHLHKPIFVCQGVVKLV